MGGRGGDHRLSIVSQLEALERVGAQCLDGFHEIIDDLRNLVVVVDGHFKLGHPLVFQGQAGQGVTDLFHADLGQFGAFDKVALVVVTVLAAQQKDAVHALGTGHP